MAEGLVNEAKDSLLEQQVGVNVFAHLSGAIEDYLQVPPVPRELPGWSNLDQPGRELFAKRLDGWASLFAAADVAVRAAVALELPSAGRLDSAVAQYHEIGPIYGTDRTWLMAAYAQTRTLAAEPVARTELLRTQAEDVMEDDAASLAPYWRWQRGRLRKQWFYESKQTVTISGAALTDHWWDWHRDVGLFELRADDSMRLYEEGQNVLRDVQRVLSGA